MKKIVSMVLVVCFLNLVCVVPCGAESLYKNTVPLLQDNVLQKEASFEVRLRQIRERQDSGRTIFFAGAGLMAAYAYTILFVKTQNGSLTFLFGIPLIASGIAWYGFNETVSANHEELVLSYEKQLQGAEEAK